MKYINQKEEGIEYRKRPGAYAIITREEDKKICLVTDGKEIFFLGGGIENEENKIDALKRELIEESGYSIKNIEKFDEVSSYLYSNSRGYLEVQATIYIAKFYEKVVEPIEQDHKILWVNPNNYVGKLQYPWHNYILNEYIEKYVYKNK